MTENKMTHKKLYITLDPKVWDRLDKMKKENGLSKSAIIAQLINERYNKK